MASIWFFFSRKEEPSPSPPPVTITGVRIPANGTPAHLCSLTTISDANATDSFLFHVPDLRHHWKTERAWKYRDLQRLDLLQDRHVTLQHHVQQKYHLQRLLRPWSKQTPQQLHHLRQRYLLHQQYHLLQPHRSSCVGTYYIFYSFTADDLPQNRYVPAWIRNIGDADYSPYSGDVFLVKMASHELYGEYGWAAYGNVGPEFLDLLIEGPLAAIEEDIS